MSEGSISIKEELYSLSVTENKRKIVYENNRFVATLPLKVVNGVLED